MHPIRYHFFPFRHMLVHLKCFRNDLNPTAIRPVHFRKAEWEPFTLENQISKKYLIYRLVFALVFIFITVYSLTCAGLSSFGLSYYLIYYTRWTVITSVVYAVVYACYILYIYFKYGEAKPVEEGDEGVQEEAQPEDDSRNSSGTDVIASGVIAATKEYAAYVNRKVKEDYELAPSRIPFVCNTLNPLESTIWILQSIIFTSSIMSCIGYWGFIFSPDEVGELPCTFPGQLLVHGVNAVCITLDLCVTAIPVHVTHVLYGAAYGSIYIIFSASYHIANAQYPNNEHGEKPYIYSFVNWHKHPIATGPLLLLTSSFLILIFQILGVLYYSLRLSVVYYYKRNVYNEHLYDYTNEWMKQQQTDLEGGMEVVNGGERGQLEAETKSKNSKVVPVDSDPAPPILPEPNL